jgi:hypothetical protein
LYSNYTTLYNFPMGTVPKGQYSFPFVLRLHNYLPGTFNEESNLYKGSIEYKLRAQIVPPKKDIDLRNEQILVIR